MRGGTRRTREMVVVSPSAFAWELPLIATLRHSTLPWPEWSFAATPLASARELGTRDRLSLVAQFAAHQALLQFAGIADCELAPEEWVLVQKRGTDTRLFRIAARPPDPATAPPPIALVQQFAELIRSPELEVLRRPWARAETVFREAFLRLTADAVADLRWVRASAHGELAAPGPELLRAIASEPCGRFAYRDAQAIETVRALAELDSSLRLVVIGEAASPLRYSAIAPLLALAGASASMTESEVAEHVVRALDESRTVVAIVGAAAFDAASRQVIQIAEDASSATWLRADAGVPLGDARLFVVGPSLDARRRLDERNPRRAWIEQFTASPAFDVYLAHGELPPDETTSLAMLAEPKRSLVAALALLGTRIPRALASRFLRELLYEQPLEELVIDGVTSLDDEHFLFAGQQPASLIPAASRAALCLMAAAAAEECGDYERAAMLYLDAGETARAMELLEACCTAENAIRLLRRVPSLSPRLAQLLTRALIAAGRYRDAREVVGNVAGDDHELLVATIERRTGDYAPALARLERMESPSFEAMLLRGELLALVGRDDEAASTFAECGASNDEERAQLAYQRGLLTLDAAQLDELAEQPYLAARYAMYAATKRGDVDAAVAYARESMSAARCVVDEIDARLDHCFALFSAGRWSESRAEAMSALTIVEETDGDRAAGGFLFTLAYLAADDGQWAHAASRISRLQHFYGSTNDERRLLELDLLGAHLAFSRGRFDEARRSAAVALAAPLPPQIREAAALILDELDTIEGRESVLRSTGTSPNRELTDRHRLLARRRGFDTQDIADPFTRALGAWERDPTSSPPNPSTGSEKLKLFRAALLHKRSEIAATIARELDLTVDLAADDTPKSDDLFVLRAAATAPFPFASHVFGELRWRFAARNRLGHWHESGSAAEAVDHDRIAAAPPPGWVACNERELLFIEGLERWPPESRSAVAAIFSTRAELHRLRRVVEQEQVANEPSRSGMTDGIVGESPAIREVLGLVVRVARRDVAVCVLGESGTGKELIARAIHRNSSRRQKTFTPVNCAALPENLIESELFGHIRGAFTGADRDRAGLIETTDGGTLFLDEIGELPLGAQAKLLRFLQEGEFRRVGDTANRSADVRIVSATNRQLEAAVEEGRFREDLYYRVRGVEILLPPLRERATDVVVLAGHFLAREREKHRSGPAKFSSEVESVIASYGWPGNVRELQNTIRAAHAMAGDAKEIDLDHLPERLRNVTVTKIAASSYQDAVTRFKRDLIEKSLLQCRGNQNRTAAMLNISRQALAYQIRELGILVKPQGKARFAEM